MRGLNLKSSEFGLLGSTQSGGNVSLPSLEFRRWFLVEMEYSFIKTTGNEQFT